MKVKRILEPVGIVDIGSNSIRLCVYDTASRVPVPMFNEKAVCALGQGMGHSNRLNPEGITPALDAIGRFVRLARAMAVERLDIMATSAVRDAEDGPDFVRRIEASLDVHVTVLSGGEEAALSAQGVLCGTPDAVGLVADIGGGSLELAQVGQGDVGKLATLPLGVLRLQDISGGDRDLAFDHIESHLSQVPWLPEVRGQSLFAVGGAWRAIARICIAQIDHPLLVLDNFTLDAEEARRLVSLISRQSRKSLEKVPGVSRKRLQTLPLAALALERLLIRAEPSQLIFSTFGMREGQFFRQLPRQIQKLDPVLAECAQMADLAGRFPEHSDEMVAWMSPLFPNEDPTQRRLRHAACLLGDIFWSEHPDYRAEQAFLKVLRLPFLGLGHRERAALALSIHVRYAGDEENSLTARIRTLLDDEFSRHARLTGLALRLGHMLSGGAPDLLRLTRLSIEGSELLLEVPGNDAAFLAELSERPFDQLARAANCERMTIRRAI